MNTMGYMINGRFGGRAMTSEKTKDGRELKRLSVKVPQDELDAFHRAAEAEDITGSQLIRRWIRKYLKENAQGDLLKG